MRFFVQIFLVLLSLLFFSCSETDTGAHIEMPSGDGDTLMYCDSSSIKAMSVFEDPEHQDTLKLDFDDFQIEFPGLSTFDNNKIQIRDTTELFIDLESRVDSSLIIIKGNNIKSVQLMEQYQTTMSLQNEGPHIELYDWKSHQSEWFKVGSVSAHTYMFKYLTDKEESQFPKFTKEEVITEIGKYEDTRSWAELIRKPEYGKWTDYFWIGVGIRRLSIKITLENGKEITKLILLYPAMGC